jgi:hypothetical protein
LCRYAEPEYSVEEAVLEGDMEGSMDGLHKHKKGKKDKPTKAQVAELTAVQRTAQAKVQVA